MNATENTQTRLLTPAELAVCIKMFREVRQWSQEQLADISGLNVRTIQRVEQGLSASLDTRRALASAFEFEDIDALNKPFAIPSEEELKAAKEKFDREHVTLTAIPLTTGKQLAKLAEICSMDLSEPGFELTREADETFAALVDYFRDYRDCADVYSETQKFEVYDEMQSHIGALKTLGVSLRYAERKMQVKWGTEPDSKPMPVNVLYVVAFPLGKEPEQFATPKSGGIRL
ncbi:helix-turn-helix domain-containing protein [Microvirgula aerodenitrificans]|uniref:helix-turn-helix domain-containing protein n=1 Tax=Microvirgula aerodenitrificans TaxID=57480 RepID=UPI00248DC835|nr:helix-turn-helix transcriptional regulator [Microvirgula aerodenitrificans]